jgi:hypothetical protein
MPVAKSIKIKAPSRKKLTRVVNRVEKTYGLIVPPSVPVDRIYNVGTAPPFMTPHEHQVMRTRADSMGQTHEGVGMGMTSKMMRTGFGVMIQRPKVRKHRGSIAGLC